MPDSTADSTPLTRFLSKMASQYKLSQAEISRRAELDSTTVNHIFKGRSSTIDHLKKIAKAMGLNPDEKQQLKRVWTEAEWDEPFKGGSDIPFTMTERLDDLERKIASVISAVKEERAHFVQKGMADKIAKFINSVCLPSVDAAFDSLSALQSELAIVKEQFVKDVHSLEPNPANPTDPLDTEVHLPPGWE